MKNWKDVLISPTTKIQTAVDVIDKSALQFCLVVDEDNRLLAPTP